ncbi:MAG: hypothetical protein ABIN72_00375 [Sphingomicrobium sp.]
MLQATINLPRDAFRDCLKQASSAAVSEKVIGDAFEAFARGKCSVQADSLRKALVAFSLKNGMGKKAAASDADLTVDDYVASPVEKYRVMNPDLDKPAAAAAAPSTPQQ